MSTKRRDFLISLASVIAISTLPISSANAETPSSVFPNDIDWDDVINDVLCRRNALLAGFDEGAPDYLVGSTHWSMERAMDQAFCSK